MSSSFTNYIQVIYDILFLLIAAFLTNLSWIGFPWKMAVIATLVMIYTYRRTGSMESMGFRRYNFKEIFGWALLLSLIVIVGISNLFNPWLQDVLGEKTDYSAYGDLEGNFEFVTQFWWKAMISAAIAEEIFYRGFLFSTLERVTGTGIWQKIFIVITTSVYFGFAHNFQGTSGVIGIIVTALVFGTIFYVSKKNIWAIILAHAIIDTWGLFSLYHGGIKLF